MRLGARSRSGSGKLLLLAASVAVSGGCAGGEPADRRARGPGAGVLSALDRLEPDLRRIMPAWRGDLPGIRERGALRVLTVFDPMFYFLDGPRQRGIVYEAALALERELNRSAPRGTRHLDVVIVPVMRHELLDALTAGRGDVVAANLTITDRRRTVVDFTEPLLTGVRELVVAGPTAPAIEKLEDLAGEPVAVRRESSYWDSLQRLSRELVAQGLPPVRIIESAPYHEDVDLLEMVNGGLIPLTVIDSHKAGFFSSVFQEIDVRRDLAVREGGEIAWAVRKSSPELRRELDRFVRAHRKGTLFGNVVYKRYLADQSWVRGDAGGVIDLDFEGYASTFKTYAARYDFDWLLIAAQAFQESHLDQSKVSPRGAVGLMQLLPSTARQVGIADITSAEANVHAGVRYLRHLRDAYFNDPALDPEEATLMSIAAYNAGPNRVRALRRRAAEVGLDPNRWFGNVEVAAAREIGSETVRYVRNVSKYYVAYSLIAERARLERLERRSGAAEGILSVRRPLPPVRQSSRECERTEYRARAYSLGDPGEPSPASGAKGNGCPRTLG